KGFEVTNVALETARAHAARRRQMCEQVRVLIVNRLELPVPPNWITDDQPLFGRGLELDSLDALELSVGIDAEFGIATYDDGAPLLGSVASFVEHLNSLEATGETDRDQPGGILPWVDIRATDQQHGAS
ncbi:MAG: acyl carrier protein, partial [Micromonosporaceae bacterium]|nr:acyl carrier protein [Micromonosporaceae bacterium]